MRLFLGVFPPPEVQQAVFESAAALRRSPVSVSWVRPENLHFTLRFLGEVGEDGAARAAESAREAAATPTSFEVAFGPLGAFPNARRARVLWAGLQEGAEPLAALASALDAALSKRGFGRAGKPFAPHLTLGRVRGTPGDWSAVLDARRSRMEAVPRFTVRHLRVVESTLSPQGSIYRSRAEAPLAS
jgi:2'-5' RNA ligase